ncbi:hypothetical protein [Methanosphaerula palustris]|uniref:Uncharacterized protein n=1 Tax=Methanosphaerula palustris (strain ATCC BAA-1556 / DSM 19958 / E1-9c) TaxID=521011 RepID=B8GK94_METPE|nr:hypothetical protein [Methanosphaerula palustris]ACL17165.1 hypothetical protein Mpal_1860 [Methanosphaerula palustris E1-9c]
MREDVRRLLLFVVTLVIGLLMIGVDLPLMQLLPVLILIGVILLFVTGALTAEDFIRFGERFKKGGKKKSVKPEKGKKGSTEVAPSKTKDKGGSGLFARMRSSLKELIPERVPRKKEEKMGGLFSRGKKEEVVKGRSVDKSSISAPAPSRGGGGKPEDPFLSLSDDELQTDLLDDLDSLDVPEEKPEKAEDLSLDMEAVTPPAEPELQGADAILSENASDLEEFTDLEGIDQIDNELASLDEVDLDEIQLSGLDGLDEADLSVPDVPDESPDAAASSTTATPDIPQFPLPQDALPDEPPKDEPDLAAFAGGMGGDNEMLSLLASDVKSVKVEADMSILRDLRDVKVSSEDLVTDLEGLMQMIGMPEVKPEKKRHGISKP